MPKISANKDIFTIQSDIFLEALVPDLFLECLSQCDIVSGSIINNVQSTVLVWQLQRQIHLKKIEVHFLQTMYTVKYSLFEPDSLFQLRLREVRLMSDPSSRGMSPNANNERKHVSCFILQNEHNKQVHL